MNYLYNGISLQNGRQSNMDSLVLKYGLINGKNALLAVVCDGVGGLKDGAFASAMAARMLNEWFSERVDFDCIGLRMRDVVLKINDYVISEAKQKDFVTATTLSALLLIESGYYAVHIGDSRIYCYEDGGLSILTSDDVSESGKLAAYIGQNDSIILKYYEGVAIGKTFLICSDGLYKRMDMGFLKGKMKSWNKRSIKESIDALAQYVIERGEQDNISLALVKIEC